MLDISFSESVFAKEREFIESIHLESNEKLKELKKVTKMDLINFEDQKDIEKLTYHFCKKARKSDRNFLLWMYVVGSHIKAKNNGSWVLIYYKDMFGERYVPSVVSVDEDIWEVGNFCYIYYYLKRRMSGISFKAFYKLDIERAIREFKYLELNIPVERFFFIEA